MFKNLYIFRNWLQGNKRIINEFIALNYQVEVLISDIKEFKTEIDFLNTKITKLQKNENSRIRKTTRKPKI
mgnify:CR=1 FL=1|tara:strand:+ start:1165 stop:1377 length:213 start_codon:yes stop_codon:yes gene_type:complete